MNSSDLVTESSPVPEKSSIAYRGLLAVVILLGVLIVIALALLIGGLTMRFSGHQQQPPAAADFTLAPGTKISSIDVNGDRIILRLRGPAGDEIDIIDAETGRLVAKFHSAPPPQRP